MTGSTTKAVFLDRDGTIIKDKHYLHKPEDVEYFDDTFEALQIMVKKNYCLFLVTNQSGVGRGWFTENDIFNVHNKIKDDLKQQGLNNFREIKYCTAGPNSDDFRRKPNPGMILELLAKYPNLDVEKCYMVGDKLRDAVAGKNANINSAIVYENPPDCIFPVFKNLKEFAKSLPI